jgi:hypothetical protein
VRCKGQQPHTHGDKKDDDDNEDDEEDEADESSDAYGV